MSWTVLKPASASAGRPMVSAQVRVTNKGKSSVVLFLAGMLYDELGAPEMAEVAIGSGDMAGHLRIGWLSPIVAGPGDFAFKSSAGGGRRLTIPLIEGVAAKQSASAPCRIIDKGDGFLVVRLPLADWEASTSPQGRPSAAQVGSRATPDGPRREEDGKVDALAYLRTKGHTVQQLANGRLQIDGELQTPPQVLNKINVHRRKADLPEVQLADLKL